MFIIIFCQFLAAATNLSKSNILLNLICNKPIDYTFNFVIYSNALSVTSEIYNKLGQHKYKTKDPDNITEYIGTYSTGNKYIYIGQLKVGTNKAEGLGICVYNTGDIQEGEWKNDKFNGHGRAIWTSGAYFIGEYEDNCRHGYGEYYDINGDVYKGNWVSSYKEGQGTMTYNDGTVKSGLWNKDKFQG